MVERFTSSSRVTSRLVTWSFTVVTKVKEGRCHWFSSTENTLATRAAFRSSAQLTFHSNPEGDDGAL